MIPIGDEHEISITKNLDVIDHSNVIYWNDHNTIWSR